MKISASLIKELREKTGAGMMDCKKALAETDGNMDKAFDYLREKGLSSVAKKSSRITSEGLVDSYIHGGRIGVLIEVNSETDFVAKNDEFKRFVRDMAMQVAAVNPKYISREEVPEEELAHEKEVLTEQARQEGKPEKIIEKMVEGRLGKFFAEIVLDEQDFVKDPDQTVAKYVASKNGANKSFTRYEVGEGIEKKADNFVEEVMSQVK